MKKYLTTLLSEKRIDLEQDLNVEGNSGLNIIPLMIVIDAIDSSSTQEQKQIKNTLVQIDFKNGDVMHFIKHLAQAIAI
jgi:hypothetical protein